MIMDLRGNKKGFYKNVSQKRKSKENVSLLLKETRNLIIWDAENNEVLNNILTQPSPPNAIATLPIIHCSPRSSLRPYKKPEFTWVYET